jgi:hypothetical protein
MVDEGVMGYMQATSLNIYAMCDAAWLPSHVMNFFVAILIFDIYLELVAFFYNPQIY